MDEASKIKNKPMMVSIIGRKKRMSEFLRFFTACAICARLTRRIIGIIAMPVPELNERSRHLEQESLHIDCNWQTRGKEDIYLLVWNIDSRGLLLLACFARNGLTRRERLL